MPGCSRRAGSAPPAGGRGRTGRPGAGWPTRRRPRRPASWPGRKTSGPAGSTSGSSSAWLGWAWCRLCLSSHHPKLSPTARLPCSRPISRLTFRVRADLLVAGVVPEERDLGGQDAEDDGGEQLPPGGADAARRRPSRRRTHPASGRTSRCSSPSAAPAARRPARGGTAPRSRSASGSDGSGWRRCSQDSPRRRRARRGPGRRPQGGVVGGRTAWTRSDGRSTDSRRVPPAALAVRAARSVQPGGRRRRRGRGAVRRGPSGRARSDGADVLRLRALLALRDVELDLLSLVELAVARRTRWRSSGRRRRRRRRPGR